MRMWSATNPASSNAPCSSRAGVVDLEALAQGIERVVLLAVSRAIDGVGDAHACSRNAGRPIRRSSASRADVEGGVVDEDLGVADELDQLLTMCPNSGLSARNSPGPHLVGVDVLRRSGLT
jgi:hypothetical protein